MGVARRLLFAASKGIAHVHHHDREPDVLAASACATTDEDHVSALLTDKTGAAEFEVEVRFVGLPREQARDLLDRIEVMPAREKYPDADLSMIPVVDDDQPLDASEPTFEVILHPLNDVASRERYAWSVSNVPVQIAPRQDGLGEVQQGLTVGAGIPLTKTLTAFESWSTPRYRCYAPFGFAASFTGPAKGCALMGYDGNAGSRCTYGYDPTSPVVAIHDGVPDDFWNWNPSEKHYFRGRVTSLGFTILHAWGTVCL